MLACMEPDLQQHFENVEAYDMIDIEHGQDHQLQSIDVADLIEQLQLHNGCERYY